MSEPRYDVIAEISVDVAAQGLHDITGQVATVVRQSQRQEGLCTLFLQHTSASLLIQENADPSARHDLERWMNRLVPDNR